MAPFAFDTLSASKQLREAGMPEGMAEAVVSVLQHAATMPDISHLATKEDLDALQSATRSDIDALRLATKADIDALRLSTKADVDGLRLGTKTDMGQLKAELDVFRAEVRAEFAASRAEFSDKLRQQMWAFLGGVALLITISTAAGRLFG